MKFYGGSNGRKRKTPRKQPRSGYDKPRRIQNFYDDDDDEFFEDQRLRTPEELMEIDDMIDNYQRYKRRKRVLVFLILVIVAAGGVILWKSYIKPPPIIEPTAPPPTSASTPSAGSTPAVSASQYTRKDGVFTFLLLGKDYEAGLTDTILVGTLDTVNKTLNVVSIPRDTLVNVSRSYKKINGLYSHNGYDIEKAKDELKTILGFKIDSYAVIDIKAFEKIVNTIGGIDFDIPINMDYDDDIQDFHVHLPAGPRHLDGAEALEVVRFRQNNEDSPYGPGYPRADIDRIATQQAFMKAVVKRCLSIGNTAKINEFAKIFKEYVNTDMSVGNMVWYGLQFLDIKSDNIDFMTMPGIYDDYALGMASCTVKLDEWLEMINTKLNPYKEEIKKSSINVITRDKNGNLYATGGKILD